ncbi:MAG: hypothetical protein ABGY42_13075 [bacterium]
METWRLRTYLLTLLAVLTIVWPAGAADTILSNGRMLLRHDGTGGREKLSFRSRGGSILLPDAGGSGDPSLNAGRLEIITREGSNTTELTLPLVAAQWRRTRSGGWKFKGHKGAELRRILLSHNGIVVVLRGGTSPATGHAGFAAMRLNFGDWRACARFAEDEILRDQNGRLVARHLRSADLANCDNSELYGACEELTAGEGDCHGSCGEGGCTFDAAQGCRCTTPETACEDIVGFDCTGSCGEGGSCVPDFTDLEDCRCVDSTMPCGDSAPICGGTCPSGLECKSSPSYPVSSCACEPPGPSCGGAAFPTCGGVCESGQVCGPLGDPLNGNYCSCLTPGADCGSQAPCAAGTYCVLGGSNFFLCLPIP